MEFLTLDRASFEYGTVAPVAPGVRRVIAENPSKFTYHGTGTYIVGEGDVAVIDPGPNLDTHRDALAAALDGERVRAILVTHCHSDHSPLSAWLAAETGAPTIAFGPHGDDTWDIGDDSDVPYGDDDDVPEADAVAEEPSAEVEVATEETVDRSFVPDAAVTTGDVCAQGPGWTVTAVHTPGHTSNHTCFAFDGDGPTTLFTGDHVMGWSTTVVSPPDGDMAAYIESLRLVRRRGDQVGIPTHGPPILDLGGYVDALVEHRLDRERQVLDVVRCGTTAIPEMVAELYVATPARLHRAAARSVLSHLVKLVDEGLIATAGGEPRPRLDSTFAPM